MEIHRREGGLTGTENVVDIFRIREIDTENTKPGFSIKLSETYY